MTNILKRLNTNLKSTLDIYTSFTKFGIAIFAVITALAGAFYAIYMEPLSLLEFEPLLILALGVYLLSSGSLALNQIQEIKLDSKMNRTRKRPLPAGQIGLFQALVLSIGFIVLGLFFLSLLSLRVFYWGVFTLILYNLFYTYYWKPKMAYGAVPGAIPGAMPILLGFSGFSDQLLSVYLFFPFALLFLWQLPHFWVLALKYQKDYEQGDVPVLPSQKGQDMTFKQIGLYLTGYVLLAPLSAFIFSVNIFLLIGIFTWGAALLFQYLKYVQDEKKWLGFFLSLNFSLIYFLYAPLVANI